MARKSNGTKATEKPPEDILPVLKQKREDIYGILLIALGFFVLLSILTGATGIIGRLADRGLAYGVGVARYLIPFGLIVWGLLFIVRRPNINAWTTGAGMSVSFIGLISLIHIGAPPEQYFDIKYLQGHGGYVGAGLAFILSRFAGKAGGLTLAVAFMMIGVVIMANPSIKDLTALIISTARKLAGRLVGSESLEEIEVEVPVRTARKRKKSSAFEIVGIDNPQSRDSLIRKIKREGMTVKGAQSTGDENEERDRHELGTYQLPPLSLLDLSKLSTANTQRDIENIKNRIEETLRNFDVNATVQRGVKGPTVTRFEIELGDKERVNSIRNLAEDISLALATPDIRIINVIPGKSNVGIEVPNRFRERVTLGDILTHDESQKNTDILAMAIGKDISGMPIMADLGEMPHILIAGATGSGKSVCLNSILMTLLMRTRPDQVKMILIDPKRIELNMFNSIPHLLTPVVTDVKKAPIALKWAVHEMEERFKKLAIVKSKNIESYNQVMRSKEARKYAELEALPYIIVVIDELADLMHVAASDVEDSICRLAQLARAVGIHLILATQRPSTDVITGLIKANIVSRIAFSVSSMTDSRVILDEGGAEKLIGKGDMLFANAGWSRPKRLQGALVTEQEIENVSAFVRSQAEPEYIKEILEENKGVFGAGEMEDDFYDAAWELVCRTQQASVSMLQRRFKVGYARAGRLIDMLEMEGIVSPPDGNKTRRVLMSHEEYIESRELERVE